MPNSSIKNAIPVTHELIIAGIAIAGLAIHAVLRLGLQYFNI